MQTGFASSVFAVRCSSRFDRQASKQAYKRVRACTDQGLRRGLLAAVRCSRREGVKLALCWLALGKLARDTLSAAEDSTGGVRGREGQAGRRAGVRTLRRASQPGDPFPGRSLDTVGP